MVFAASVGITLHLLPQILHWTGRIGQHGVQRRQAGVGNVAFLLLVQEVQDAADDQRLTGFLPVIPQPLAIGIDDAGRQILRITNLVVRSYADLLHRIPVRAAVGRSRLKAQNMVIGVFLSPTGG